MKKAITLLLSLIILGCYAYAEEGKAKIPFNYDLSKDINREPGTSPFVNNDTNQNQNQNNGQNNEAVPEVRSHASGENEWVTARSFYPNATIKTAIGKYKQGNYSGCLQELISVSKKDPYNPLVLYYLGMAYSQVGNKQQAINAYEAVINMNSNPTLTSYATKGRDCIVGGPACYEEENQTKIEDELDRFINSPYGNGLSDELNQQMKEQQLRSIQNRIKTKDVLEDTDMERIQKFDKNKSETNIDNEKIAMADTKDVTNEDVLAAIETLKKAGVTVSVNPYQNQIPMNDEYAQLSMMLGNNNYNNNNSMMNMLPMLITQNKGQIDPQVIQTMMMSSMLPDFTFNDNKKDY